MNRITLLLLGTLCCLFLSLSLFAQNTPDPSRAAAQFGIPTNPKLERNESLSFGERLFFGGDFGLSLGRTNTFINISPLAGYKLNKAFSVGVGPVFQYWQDQVIYIDFQTGVQFQKEISSMIYGGKTFGRAFLFKGLFANLEAEYINADLPIAEGLTDRRWIPALWAGAGYNIRIADKAGVNIMLLYNPIFDEQNSPYSSPFDVRVGFVF